MKWAVITTNGDVAKTAAAANETPGSASEETTRDTAHRSRRTNAPSAITPAAATARSDWDVRPVLEAIDSSVPAKPRLMKPNR